MYDWRADVMSEHWDPVLARKRLRAQPDTLVCDALLDQDLFAGVGNIIKNEVLFASACIRCRPSAPCRRRAARLVREARQYSFDFSNGRRRSC